MTQIRISLPNLDTGDPSGGDDIEVLDLDPSARSPADFYGPSFTSVNAGLSAMQTPTFSPDNQNWWLNKRMSNRKVFKPSRTASHQEGNLGVLPRKSDLKPFRRKGKYLRSKYELMEIDAETLDSVHAMTALRIFQETFGRCVFNSSTARVADLVRIGVYRMFILVGSMTSLAETMARPAGGIPGSVFEEEYADDGRIDRPETLAVMFAVEHFEERSLHCDYWAVKQQAQSHGMVMSRLFRDLLKDIGYMWLSAECEPQLINLYVQGGAIDTSLDYYFVNTSNRYFPMHFVIWPLQRDPDSNTSLERIQQIAGRIILDLRLRVHGISGCPVEGKPPKNFKRTDPLDFLIRTRKQKGQFVQTQRLPTTEEAEPRQESACFIFPFLLLALRRYIASRRLRPSPSPSRP